MIMTNAEQVIAKLINEGKITGEEAIILINACKPDHPKSNLDGWPLHKTIMYEHSNDDKNKLTHSISTNENYIRAYNTSVSL